MERKTKICFVEIKSCKILRNWNFYSEALTMIEKKNFIENQFNAEEKPARI